MKAPKDGPENRFMYIETVNGSHIKLATETISLLKTTSQFLEHAPYCETRFTQIPQLPLDVR